MFHPRERLHVFRRGGIDDGVEDVSSIGKQFACSRIDYRVALYVHVDHRLPTSKGDGPP